MQQWRLGKEARLDIQILAGEKVLSRVVSHMHSSMQACMCMCVLIYSFIHLFVLHSLIYLLFIYPSINLFIHSSYLYWNPCSVLGVIVLWRERTRHAPVPKKLTAEKFQPLLVDILTFTNSSPNAASVSFSVRISCQCEM